MVNNESFLLDTHAFVWWMKEDKRLKKSIKAILENSENRIFLSVVSIWEMAIKKKIGKLRLPRNWKETIKDSNFELLSIDVDHAFLTETFPLYHKDPFDRMLIAQAKVENLTIITTDKKFQKYKIKLLRT